MDAYWLRARWVGGGYAATPRLARLMTNTVWASNVSTVRDEVVGSSTGEERQRMSTTRAPILPGQRLEVRELGTPSAPELATILEEEGPDAVTPLPAEPGRPGECWVRWHPVVDFYGSGTRSRHYVVDRVTGELRFGDGQRGMAPPQGRGNVRATLYRTGGGAVGNRPAGAITELKAAVPYVGGVINTVPAGGGADAESLDAVRERGPRILRHGNRAVTIGDLEDLARDASASVARVLGVPATGQGDAGAMGVVLVPASEAPQPVPTLDLLERVRAHVERRMTPSASLWVAGPGWIRVDVEADVVPVSADEATDVANAVRAAVARFLHPLLQGPQGSSWAFGRTPRRSDVLAVIEGVAGVDHVRGLAVHETRTAPEPAAGASLIYSGDHVITMASSTDGALA